MFKRLCIIPLVLVLNGCHTCSCIPPPPQAAAGPDQQVLVGEQVTLDGSASHVFGNVRITAYHWVFEGKPSSSQAALVFDPDTPIATFTPDVVGDYQIKLTISTSHRMTREASDTLSVSARTP